MAAADIIEKARGYLQGLRTSGFEVSFGILFGSHALESAGEWSDIDLVVVSPRFDGQKLRADIDRLWVATLDADERIEPIPCGLQEWLSDDSRAIVEIARRHGRKITLDIAA